MKLVPYAVKKFKIPDDPAISYDDMIQVGYLALWEACKIYDSEKGQLSTIAVPYIRGRVQRMMRDCAPVRVSNYTMKIITSICRNGFNLPLSDEEKEVIQEETGLSMKMINEYQAISITSYDVPVLDDEEDSSLVNIIKDNAAYIEFDYTDCQLEELVDTLVEIAFRGRSCKDKNKDIIEEWIYSIVAGERLTTVDLGKKYDMSRQCADVIINKACENLIKYKKEVYHLLT